MRSTDKWQFVGPAIKFLYSLMKKWQTNLSPQLFRWKKRYSTTLCTYGRKESGTVDTKRVPRSQKSQTSVFVKDIILLHKCLFKITLEITLGQGTCIKKKSKSHIRTLDLLVSSLTFYRPSFWPNDVSWGKLFFFNLNLKFEIIENHFMILVYTVIRIELSEEKG